MLFVWSSFVYEIVALTSTGAEFGQIQGGAKYFFKKSFIAYLGHIEIYSIFFRKKINNLYINICLSAPAFDQSQGGASTHSPPPEFRPWTSREKDFLSS